MIATSQDTNESLQESQSPLRKPQITYGDLSVLKVSPHLKFKEVRTKQKFRNQSLNTSRETSFILDGTKCSVDSRGQVYDALNDIHMESYFLNHSKHNLSLRKIIKQRWDSPKAVQQLLKSNSKGFKSESLNKIRQSLPLTKSFYLEKESISPQKSVTHQKAVNMKLKINLPQISFDQSAKKVEETQNSPVGGLNKSQISSNLSQQMQPILKIYGFSDKIRIPNFSFKSPKKGNPSTVSKEDFDDLLATFKVKYQKQKNSPLPLP